jgi:uncharacterized protein YhaN
VTRVERLDLVAYGHYADATLDLSSPRAGLTVIWGPNEAGKSTARHALLAALFGFERDEPGAYRYGRHGVRLGIEVSVDGGRRISFVREGASRIRRPDGGDVDAVGIEGLVGGMSRESYTRLFAIDHEELRVGSDSLLEADGEIGRLIYGASLGSGAVAAVLRDLDERAGRLFSERGRVQRIPKALDAYRTGVHEARSARVRAREWERRRETVATAEARRVALRAELESARAEHARLDRLRSARPLLARRADIVGQLERLGPVPTTDWAERVRSALTRRRAVESAHAAAVALRDRIAAAAESVAASPIVLEHSERVDRLVEGVDRYRKDTVDLPKRQAELEAARRRLGDKLGALGMRADDGRIVAEAELANVERLARVHVELVAAGHAIDDELARAEEQVAHAAARLAEDPEPRDVADVERALVAARALLEVDRSLAGRRATQTHAVAELAASVGRLGLAGRGWEEVEALALPLAPEVEIERERRDEQRFALSQLRDQRDAVVAEMRSVSEQAARIGREVPDPDRLEVARRHRDAGWRLVRQMLEGGGPGEEWEPGRPLVAAFEQAIGDADAAADERYEHADAVAGLHQLQGRLGRLAEQQRALDEQERRIEASDAVASARWAARWATAGLDAAAPEVMAEWLQGHRELVVAISRWRADQRDLDAATEQVDRCRAALDDALGRAGCTPVGEGLELAVARADEMVRATRAQDASRRDAETASRLARDSVARQQASLDAHREEMVAWRAQWEQAVRPLALGALAPDVAGSVVSALRSLVVARADVAGLESRISGIEEDRRRYEEQVDEIARKLPIVTDVDAPLGVVLRLQGEVAQARTARERHATLTEELAEAETVVDARNRELEDVQRLLRSLRTEAAMADAGGELDFGIDAVASRALEAAALREKLVALEQGLLDLGDGRSLEQITADATAAGESLAMQTELADEQVQDLARQLEIAIAQVVDAERARDAVTDAATAADLEQDAEAELALASGLVGDYARAALAAEVLRRTIAEYGERHRGPLLERAGALFCQLTDGAFVELVPDGDGHRQILLAKRRGGELCATPALSDGTRDQLYLALRVAGVEHQLGSLVEALPVVFDDILVHFDDRRSAAAIRVLGELSGRTQVLLFTHHERVVEIAQQCLEPHAVGVVRLPARRHDDPPALSAGPPQRTSGGRAQRDDMPDHEEAAQAILDALREAGGRALAKSELLELSGVAEAAWTSTIRTLVARGVLVQEGQRRGARYRLCR